MNDLQKGFIAPLLLALIALLILGGGVYVYTQKKQENPPVTENVALPQSTSTAPTTNQTTPVAQVSNSETANWETYRDEKFGFEIKYPPEFNVSHGGGYISPDNNWTRVSFKKPPLSLVFFAGTRPTSGGCGEGGTIIWTKKIVIAGQEYEENWLEYYNDYLGKVEDYCWSAFTQAWSKDPKYGSFFTGTILKNKQDIDKFLPQIEAIAKTLHYTK